MVNWSIEEFDNLPSTQDYLKNNTSLPEGTVIRAINQSAGHGRHGRKWLAGQGNLYLSLLIKPECELDKLGQLSLLTGLAVANIMPDNAVLKWANDILIGGRKCCGILLDHENGALIIGIGVNIKSAPLDGSTFLQNHMSSEIDAKTFMTKLLESFAQYYERWQREGFETLRGEWLTKTYAHGQKISVKIGDNHVTGSFETIDMLGNLILICDKTGEIKKITSGEVFLL